jgi:Arc/MetJ family transcription regulator
MKTTVDIPEAALNDAMRFTGAKTKREAVVKALEDFNRRQRAEALIKLAGSMPHFPSNDEIEATDMEYEARMAKRWTGTD